MTFLPFEEILRRKYDELSPGQKKAADHLMNNLETSSYGTLAAISREAGVSETTIIRLSGTLGFRGYSDMQSRIRDQILLSGRRRGNPDEEGASDGSPFERSIEREMDILRQMKNELDPGLLMQVAKRIAEADQIAIIGTRTAGAAADWLAMTLGCWRERVLSVPPDGDSYRGLLDLTGRSVAIAISFPRYARATQRFAEGAKKAGATLVAVTDSPLSPIGRIADFTLLTRKNRDETGLDSIASVISLLNLMVIGVSLQGKEEGTRRLQRLEAICSDRGDRLE